MDDNIYSNTTQSSQIVSAPTKKSISEKNISEKASRITASTQFFKRDVNENEYKRISRKEYFEDTAESIARESSDCFGCIDEAGYQESARENLYERLNTVPEDWKLTAHCPPAYGWFMAKKLSYFVKDPSIARNTTRLLEHFRDFVKISENGFKINILKELVVIFHYLCDNRKTVRGFHECLTSLIRNIDKPISLDAASDIITHLPALQDYIEHLGYLLISLDDDELFNLLSRGVLWQLLASNKARGIGTVRRAEILVAASHVLLQTSIRMIAVATSERLPAFLEIALILGYYSEENCLTMMKENIIENIFIRFNPYSPLKPLPDYEINPADPQDCNVQMGDGNKYITTIISLLFIVLEKTRQAIEKDSSIHNLLACPDVYAQRCFTWGYLYECRSRGHHRERNALTIIVTSLLHIYGEKLTFFSYRMMPDIMTMSIHTDLPQDFDWLDKITFDKSVVDVKFKINLIRCSVKLIKTFPANRKMMESRYWLLGLVYLIDPDLGALRVNWSPSLYVELRKTALQAIICTLPYAPKNAAEDYNIVRRMLWYAEWYLENPYELSLLYWCLRLLKVAMYRRKTEERRKTIRTLFNTHGIVVLINLCHKLLKEPLVEKRQIILSLLLQSVTSALEMKENVTCCLYPGIIWPKCVNMLSAKILTMLQDYIECRVVFTDRWLISIINFLWEAIIWNDDNRRNFIANNGIYKLLDIITMSGREVQCICLALICDMLRAEEGIGHLITWRARITVNNSNLAMVKGGATIATLLARLFRDDCKLLGINLDERCIIQDLENPLMAADVRKLRYIIDFAFNDVPTVSAAAADAAGSRMSKAFAILQMLSEDLEYKVNVVDEAYKLYKNISLSLEDEVVLVLCSHYVTIKLNEAWTEVSWECPVVHGRRETYLEEFLQLKRWWVAEVKKQQEEIYKKNKQEDEYVTRDFFSFLSRIRLNVALDALRDLINADKPISTMKKLLEMQDKSARRLIVCKSLDADQAISSLRKIQ